MDGDEAQIDIRLRLRVIADMLNIPVEQFYAKKPPTDRLDEVIRLWLSFKTDEGRSAAIDALRGALRAEQS